MVHPLKHARVRQAHWKEHLISITHGSDLDISLSSLLQHPARERERCQWNRTEVDMQGDTPESERGIQSLAQKVGWKLLGRCNAQTIVKETDGVGVGRGRIEVQQQSYCLASQKLWSYLDPLRLTREKAFGIETNVAFGGGQKQGRLGKRNANAHEALRFWTSSLGAQGFVGQTLHDPDFEEITSRFRTRCGPDAREQILKTALAERGHQRNSHTS
mmetsp:Transcript_21748/g.57666  ORF Transcript_21748/g.57666 Transcript_21748/m.57666 type:complete len:216 (+) Transcript_21748:312-959(+)